MKDIINNIKAKIAEYETIIVLRHKNPDGDALGSALGLGIFLQKMFPEKRIVTDGVKTPNYLSFLASLPTAHRDDYPDALAIVCDTANIERIDSEHFKLAKEIIKIDHHPEVDPYGDINWVESARVAATELVTELVQSYSMPLPASAATALFVGIVTDSNRFLFVNTTNKTFALASYLMDFIPDVTLIYNHLYQMDLNTFALKNKIAQQLKISSAGVGYATFNQSQINALHTDYFTIKSMVNIFSNITNVPVWMIAVDNCDLNNIKISVRSRKVDIGKVAAQYNGGGHANAAACYLDSWDQLPHFISDLDNAIKQTPTSKTNSDKVKG